MSHSEVWSAKSQSTTLRQWRSSKLQARKTVNKRAQERFAAVARMFEEVYGMRLPKHLTFGAAFFLGLSDEERALCQVSLLGFAQWFEWLAPGLPERVATLDGRLEGRYRADPPEFLSIASGNTDGSHWGLFYDDPRELPTVVAHGYARDDGVVSQVGTTLLASIRKEVSARSYLDADDKRRVRGMVAWLDALRPFEDAARAEENIASPPSLRVELGRGGIGVYLPGWTPPAGLIEGYDRWEAMASDAVASEWVARAEADLAHGDGSLAVVVGLDLHHGDRDSQREACTRLLVNGYRALGRDALAEIARVHHATRNLSSVSVYWPKEAAAQPRTEWVPPPALLAARALDMAALEAAIAGGASGDDLAVAADSLTDAAKPECATMLARVLGVGKNEVASRCLGGFLINVSRSLDPEYLVKVSTRSDAQLTKQIVDILLEPKDLTLVHAVLDSVSALSTTTHVQFAISTGDAEIAARVIAMAEPADLIGYRGGYQGAKGFIEGASLLHYAVGAMSVPTVRLLLDRGLDPRVKDDAGNTPRSLAKMAWFVRPNEANEIVAMLDTMGPGVLAPSTALSFRAGTRVSHKKFGNGVIETVSGAGDEAKVTVKFASETKTLQQKFLTLKTD